MLGVAQLDQANLRLLEAIGPKEDGFGRPNAETASQKKRRPALIPVGLTTLHRDARGISGRN